MHQHKNDYVSVLLISPCYIWNKYIINMMYEPCNLLLHTQWKMWKVLLSVSRLFHKTGANAKSPVSVKQNETKKGEVWNKTVSQYASETISDSPDSGWKICETVSELRLWNSVSRTLEQKGLFLNSIYEYISNRI